MQVVLAWPQWGSFVFLQLIALLMQYIKPFFTFPNHFYLQGGCYHRGTWRTMHCRLVFALTVKEPLVNVCVCVIVEGVEGEWVVTPPPTPPLPQYTCSVTIYAKTTLHCSPGSSMLPGIIQCRNKSGSSKSSRPGYIYACQKRRDRSRITVVKKLKPQ
jgi:hypothetical protein